MEDKIGSDWLVGLVERGIRPLSGQKHKKKTGWFHNRLEPVKNWSNRLKTGGKNRPGPVIFIFVFFISKNIFLVN